jgi:hypothetical protein
MCPSIIKPLKLRSSARCATVATPLTLTGDVAGSHQFEVGEDPFKRMGIPTSGCCR